MENKDLIQYAPIAIMFVLAFGFVATTMAVTHALGPKRKSKTKLDPFECGIESQGNARVPFNIKYFLVAILFVLFDVEVIFMYPWAVNFKDLGTSWLRGNARFYRIIADWLLLSDQKRCFKLGGLMESVAEHFQTDCRDGRKARRDMKALVFLLPAWRKWSEWPGKIPSGPCPLPPRVVELNSWQPWELTMIWRVLGQND